MARLRKPLALPAVHPNAGIKAALSAQARGAGRRDAGLGPLLAEGGVPHRPSGDGDGRHAGEGARRGREPDGAALAEEVRRGGAGARALVLAAVGHPGGLHAAHRILRDGGFSVRFKLTPAMRDVAAASVAENVQLIKSIPQKYLGDVHGAVMRSVQAGRDLASLTKEIQKLGVVTRKRAALIALDQNNKATSAILKARQIDLGITEGVWLHSHGGKEPRPTHLDNHGKKFSIVDGWFDPDPHVRKRIMPGELIRCRCVWKPVIKGFS